METIDVQGHIGGMAQTYADYVNACNAYIAAYPEAIQTPVGIANLQQHAELIHQLTHRFNMHTSYLSRGLTKDLTIKCEPGSYMVIGIPGVVAVWLPVYLSNCIVDHYPNGLDTDPEEQYLYPVGGLPEGTVIATNGLQYQIVNGAIVVLQMPLQ